MNVFVLHIKDTAWGHMTSALMLYRDCENKHVGVLGDKEGQTPTTTPTEHANTHSRNLLSQEAHAPGSVIMLSVGHMSGDVENKTSGHTHNRKAPRHKEERTHGERSHAQREHFKREFSPTHLLTF